MATRSARPCLTVNCKKLVRPGDPGADVGRCPEHALTVHARIEERERERDRMRATRTQRGYDNRWVRASKAWLMRPEHALCATHLKRNEIVDATCVDHVIPHKGNMKLFWDEKNWQPLCHSCHSIKTATEDGGFGRPVVSPSP